MRVGLRNRYKSDLTQQVRGLMVGCDLTLGGLGCIRQNKLSQWNMLTLSNIGATLSSGLGWYMSNAEKLIIKSMLASLFDFFSSKKLPDQEQYIRFTYRSHIQKVLPSTYYDSDAGWGCMLRVTQMAIANLLYKKQSAKIHTIAPLFWDNSDMPFSLQTLTLLSQQLFPSKKQYEWYTPCEAGFLLKQSMQNFNLTFNVSVCNDNSIFLNEIASEKENIVILVMSRIGLDKPQKQYLETLTHLMDSQYFFSILGGTPKYAHLFFKHKDGYFGYLDPHQTKRCPEQLQQVLDNSKQNLGKLQWIRKQKISTSMCIMFLCKNTQINDFWTWLQDLKSKLGQKFFLYMDQCRPEVNSQDGIVQIMDMEQATK